MNSPVGRFRWLLGLVAGRGKRLHVVLDLPPAPRTFVRRFDPSPPAPPEIQIIALMLRFTLTVNVWQA